jgi:signal transduction histidine kinase
MTFRIEDTGIGMSVDQIPVALEPFGQIDTGLDRKRSGVGLGLPLTKRLVELHDGTIEIESEPGTGTIVTVRLPEERLRQKPTDL